MASIASHSADGRHAEKRLKRHLRPHVQRTSTQSSPLVIMLAVAGAVVLVLGAIAGAMAFNKPGSNTKINAPAVPDKEAPAPPSTAQP